MPFLYLVGTLLGLTSPNGALDACTPARIEASEFEGPQHEAATGDLAYFDVTSATGRVVGRVYFEPALETVARQHLSCLSAMLGALEANDDAGTVPARWAPVVFTTDEAYRAPGTAGEVRWPIHLQGGQWTEATDRFFFETLPHEQVHARQRQFSDRLPRWFEEGHAEWAGLKVTQQVRPMLASARRQELMSASRRQSVHLTDWGAMRVKPEAIERQLSPEERQRRAAYPTYVPKGPFKFGPGDLVRDDEPTSARYGAALRVFDELEARHGRVATNRWVANALASFPQHSLSETTAADLGENLSDWID